MHGYREVFGRGGHWHGQYLPQHGRFYIRLAPLNRPEALITVAMNDGSADEYIPAHQVSDIRATSDGATFFGFGLGGMVAAGVAARLDHMLAPWELVIEGPPGFLHFYARHGPPPLADEWARVQERLNPPASAGSDEDAAMRPVIRHILHEKRIGLYPLDDDEHASLVQVLSNLGSDLAASMVGRVDTLRIAVNLFGVASACQWYSDDPYSQELVDWLAHQVGLVSDALSGS